MVKRGPSVLDTVASNSSICTTSESSGGGGSTLSNHPCKFSERALHTFGTSLGQVGWSFWTNGVTTGLVLGEASTCTTQIACCIVWNVDDSIIHASLLTREMTLHLSMCTAIGEESPHSYLPVKTSPQWSWPEIPLHQCTSLYPQPEFAQLITWNVHVAAAQPVNSTAYSPYTCP